MSTTTTKRTYTKFDSKVEATLLFLLDNRNSTVKEIGITLPDAKRMAEQGIVKVAAVRKHTVEDKPGRGRPSFEFDLTPNARKKARRLAKKVAQAQPVEAQEAVTA